MGNRTSKSGEINLHEMLRNPKLIASVVLPLVIAGSYLWYQHRKKETRRVYSVVECDRQFDDPRPAQDGNQELRTWTSLGLDQPVVIAMVGLPARGKSYIVKMLQRYLKWTGIEAEVFNVGSYRRKMGMASADSNFFSPTNADAKKIREELAMKVQDMMYQWLREDESNKSRVAIFDATNTTKSRRQGLADRAKEENVFLLFVESICDNPDVLRRNYELKLENDDYQGMDKAVALKDFTSRVAAYEKVYETIGDEEDNDEISYIKLINVGQKVITRNCTGYLPSQIAFFLQNVHIRPRKIYLCMGAEHVDSQLAGHSESESDGRLTEEGRIFAVNLAKYVYHRQELAEDPLGRQVLVLSGTSKVAEETIHHLRNLFTCYSTPLLNELRGGELHGLLPEQMKEQFPEEFKKRMEDKLRYRYPGVGGESYWDVIERIRPVIIELERQRRSSVVVCQLAVLRCIYAYFMGIDLEEIPFQHFDRHTIYELTPGPFGSSVEEVNPTLEVQDM